MVVDNNDIEDDNHDNGQTRGHSCKRRMMLLMLTVDIYIMIKCLSVCLCVTKNHHFRAEHWRRKVRCSLGLAGRIDFGLVMLMGINLVVMQQFILVEEDWKVFVKTENCVTGIGMFG